MRINLASGTLAMMAVLSFGISAIAQHGRPAGAGGGMGMGAGASAGHGNMGTAGSAHAGTASQAPSSALSNPKLDSSLTAALGHSGITVPGGNLQQACSGFKNLGQCIAAMHVAKNLGLSFSDLQSKMTGSGAVSLGKAIQELGGPTVNAKSEAKKGSKQANQEIAQAESNS